MITLNQRLTSVCNYLVPGKLADIGSDHAYLPIYAIQNNLISSAIAGEVIKGPYEAARKNVLVNQLNDVIDVRLGDGLSVISKSESIQNITICGMGGPLIAKILKEGKEHLVQGPRLVLQSNIQTEALRYTLMSINYHIVDEIIMEEKGYIYEIVVAEYNTTSENLNNKELKFGPMLLQKKNEIFYKKWNHELEALKHIRNQLNSESHHERLKEIENDISLITEVLNYED